MTLSLHTEVLCVLKLRTQRGRGLLQWRWKFLRHVGSHLQDKIMSKPARPQKLLQTNKQTNERASMQSTRKQGSKHAKQFLALQVATSLSIKGQGYISMWSTLECLRGPDKARVKVPEDVTMWHTARAGNKETYVYTRKIHVKHSDKWSNMSIMLPSKWCSPFSCNSGSWNFSFSRPLAIPARFGRPFYCVSFIQNCNTMI